MWSETSVAPSQLTQFWQIPRHSAFLFPVQAMFRHDCPLVVKPASTPRHLGHKKIWEILCLLICCPSVWPSRPLYRRGQKSQRDLWITVYFLKSVSTFVHLWLYSCCPLSEIDVGFTDSAWWAFVCWIPSEVDHSLDTGHGISRFATYPLMSGKA
jgi:hypothetical protein